MADKTCNDCRQRMTCIMAAPDGKWTACEQFEEKEMDLIDRQTAIDAVNTALFPKINTAKDAEKALKQLPSAEKTGRWLNNQNGTFTCSVCGCKHSRSKFCPNCGSRMVV